MSHPQNSPKIQKLEAATVPLDRLGISTLNRPISEENKRLHAAAIRRALKHAKAS